MATATTETAPSASVYELSEIGRHSYNKQQPNINETTVTTAQDVDSSNIIEASAPVARMLTKRRFASIFLGFFIQGVNDSVTGTLLPYMQATYNIEYAIASLVFVGNTVGFIAAVPFIQYLDNKFGRLRTLLFAVICNIVAYSIIISQPPFPVVAVCFGILGYGFSTILALDNSLIANTPNATLFLGIQQGGYGVGGTVAPLLGTAMASHGVRWSFFYCISLALSVINAVLFTWSFYDFKPLPKRNQSMATNQSSTSERSPLLQAVRNRSALLGSVFVFAYQGAEVTISGWVPSFLIDYRHGDPARVGYVTSGFWGGITVGRFVLCPLIEKLGDRRCIFGLIFVWACFHIIVWLAHDIVGIAVAVALIGVLSGPIAPVATGVLSKLLDPSIQVSGIAMAWSIGSGGAAVVPFITGVLAEQKGAVVLNPTCIVLCAVMECGWLGLPGRTWKKE